MIGQGGWQQFGFLFSGADNVIYAAERALDSGHNYSIDGTLNVRIERCFDKKLAVNQATVALDEAKNRLRDLRTQFGQAGSQAEREAIQLDIDDVESEIQELEAQLAAAKAALEACLNSFHPAHGGVFDDPVVMG